MENIARRLNMKWIRPAISLIAVGGLTVGFFLKMITAEAYIGIMGMAIAWWYKARDESKPPS